MRFQSTGWQFIRVGVGTLAEFQGIGSVWDEGGSMRGGWWRPNTITGWSESFHVLTDMYLSPFWLPTLIPSLFHYPHAPPAVFLLSFWASTLLPTLMLPPGRPTQFNLTHLSRSAQGELPAGILLCHLPIHLACFMCPVPFEVPGIQQWTIWNPFLHGAYLVR